MTVLEILLLAFALSIDAFVVSFSYGLLYDKSYKREAFLLALFTGAFQGLMPSIAYYLTNFVKTFIEPFANIIVFAIFLFLGIKIIQEACQNKKEKPTCLGLLCLFLIGIATSIDAFSAGITIALSDNPILQPAILIALVTFINSCFGFALGGKLKGFSCKYIEIFAGLILIYLGIKAIL